MEDLLRSWDGESVVLHLDRPTGAWIIIAIHSTHLGPGTGGTRLKHYPDLAAAARDALLLAEGMTYKFATIDFPRGGAKAVIAIPPVFDPSERTGLLRRYGALIHQLGGLFETGPDIGTTSADMDLIAETGAPYVRARTPAAGGAGDSAPATALGVFHAIQVSCETAFGDPSLRDRRVLVQGAGSVGGRLIALLQDAGATVLAADVDQAALRRHIDVEHLSAADVYTTPCDVFAPCALGGILNHETIPLLRCRAVAGAANNQLAHPADAERLRARGILYAPDFVVNLGGAAAITGRETMGWSEDEASRQIIEAITSALRQVLRIAAEEGITTAAAALRLAEARLAAPSPTSYK